MAFVGMKYCVAAPIQAETRGQAITYGSGVVVGEAIGATINFSRNSGGIYGDDMLVDSDNSVTGGTVEINVVDIRKDAIPVIFSVSKDSGDSGGADVYHELGDASPDIGLGYIRVNRYKGKYTYYAYWIHKAQLAINNETASTKKESIEWQTPTASGNIMGVVIDSTGKTVFRDYAQFDTEAAATTWLNTRANIAGE